MVRETKWMESPHMGDPLPILTNFSNNGSLCAVIYWIIAFPYLPLVAGETWMPLMAQVGGLFYQLSYQHLLTIYVVLGLWDLFHSSPLWGLYEVQYGACWVFGYISGLLCFWALPWPLEAWINPTNMKINEHSVFGGLLVEVYWLGKLDVSF